MNSEYIGSMSSLPFKVRKTCTSEIASTPFRGVQRGEIPLERGYKGVSPLNCLSLDNRKVRLNGLRRLFSSGSPIPCIPFPRGEGEDEQ